MHPTFSTTQSVAPTAQYNASPPPDMHEPKLGHAGQEHFSRLLSLFSTLTVLAPSSILADGARATPHCAYGVKSVPGLRSSTKRVSSFTAASRSDSASTSVGVCI